MPVNPNAIRLTLPGSNDGFIQYYQDDNSDALNLLATQRDTVVPVDNAAARPANPAEDMMIFQRDNRTIYHWNGTVWQAIAGGGGGGPAESTLPLLQQAIQHVKLANAVSQVMEANGTPSQFTLQNGSDTITQEFNFDASGNPSLFIFTSPAIEAFAMMNGAPVGQRDLERTFTFTPGMAIPTSEWTFGSGEALSFSFDRTRGVFREIRDLGDVSTITSRGEFNISSGYNIDSRGQVTEA